LQLPSGGANVVYTALPGVTYTVTVPAGETYKLSADAFGTTYQNGAPFNDGLAQYEIFVDGVASGSLQRVQMEHSVSQYTITYSPWSISHVVTLTAGTHTIDVRGANALTGTATTVNLCDNTPGFQATLNVVVYR
jgi:hypothetical protein